MRLPKYTSGYKASVLISVLISLALFSILAHALFTLVTTSYSVSTYNNSRINAKHLAQEKMEVIRNMPYDSIGTVGGIPPGTISQNETVSLNGANYYVKTIILYIDDPFDQQAPDDLLATDYKRITIDVSWEGEVTTQKNPIRLVTDISPPGIETTVTGGTLSVIVIDANAQPVNQASVHVVATTTTPTVDLTLYTSDNGRVILPGAPVCATPCYQITASKSGYSTEKTYSISEVDNPNKPNLTVLQGQLSEVSFTIDRLSTLDVYSKDNKESGFGLLGNINFTIRGDKTIGTDTDEQPVYKYIQNHSTDASGHIELTNLEWDNYYISISSAVGDIEAINPYLPININPDSQNRVDFAVTNDTSESVLVTFVDPSDKQIASVSARLYGSTPPYEASASSGLSIDPDFGQVYFSDLQKKIYSIEATKSGYFNFNGTIDAFGYKNETIILNPI